MSKDPPGGDQSGGSLPKITPLPGVLLTSLVRCGKLTCRCVRGNLHGPYLYRRWREDGRQRRKYVKPCDVWEIEAALAAWQRLHPPAWRMRRELAALRRLSLTEAVP